MKYPELPCWMYFPDKEPVIVHNETKQAELWAQGWRDTPAIFLQQELAEEEGPGSPGPIEGVSFDDVIEAPLATETPIRIKPGRKPKVSNEHNG